MSDVMRTSKVTVRLRPSDRAALETLAGRLDMTMSAAARAALLIGVETMSRKKEGL